MRLSGRKNNELRAISFEPHYTPYAEGSCLVKYGNTHVLCTASIDTSVPPFLRGQKKGWVTAEYAMLPRATHQRSRRDQGRPSGRSTEIQRFIGRSLRSAVNMAALGERQVIVDCDVLQADGGTRTAAISGGYVALAFACNHLQKEGLISTSPLKHTLAAVSCGLHQGEVWLDLDYAEDSTIGVDANFVMTETGHLIEVQAASEAGPFQEGDLIKMLDYARSGIQALIQLQKQAIGG